MSTVTSSSAPIAGPSVTASGTRGPQGRSAEQPEGRSFGAALERSRAASQSRTPDAEQTAAPVPGAGRKPARGEQKSELSAADVMAMLAPLTLPATHDAAHAKAGAIGADGLAVDAAPRTLPDAAATLAAAAQADAATATEEDAAHDGAPGTAARPAPQASATDPALQARALPSKAADAATTPPIAAGVAQPSSASAAPSPEDASAPNASLPPVASSKAPSTPQPAAIDGAKTALSPAASAASAAGPLDAAPGTAPQPLAPLQALTAPPIDRAAAPASNTPVLSVAPPVGSDAWGPAIGQQMIRMSASGHHVAELNLNPAGLGPLKVTLTMGDNQAQAMFMSAHESVRKAIEAALPQLRTTLAEQGISLGQTSVGAEPRQPSGQGGAFAEQNPSRQRGPSDDPGARRPDTVDAPASLAPAAPARGRTGSSLDTFA